MIKKSYLGLLALFLIILCATSVSASDDVDINDTSQVESVVQLDSEIPEIDSISDSNSDIVESTGSDSVKIIVENAYLYYKDGTRFNAYLIAGNGSYIGNALIKINVAGCDYYAKTNSEGLASLSINLNPGNYQVVTSYGGASVKSVIIVTASDAIEQIQDDASIIALDEFVIKEGESAYFSAFLVDENDDPFVNQPLKFVLNNVIYNKRTNDEGIAKIPINLDPGVYPLIISYGIKSVESLVIVESIAEEIIFNNTKLIVNDVYMNYEDGSRFKAQLFDENGAPIANAKITVLVNGATYNKTTDQNGSISAAIHLDPGSYHVFTIYGNSTSESKILVNSEDSLDEIYYDVILKMNEFEMFYGDGSTYKAKLTDLEGNPIVNAQIQFAVGDNIYNRRTGVDGVAEFKVNLQPGSYDVTASYGPLKTNSTILVKSSDEWYDENLYYNTVLWATRLSMVYRDGSYFTATLYNDGIGAKNARITFTLAGKNYTAITDSSGNARLLINLNPGYYLVQVAYCDSKGNALAKCYSDIIVDDTNYDNRINKVSSYENYYLSENFEVSTEDKFDHPISNEVLDFYCNGVHYYRTTNHEGIASFGENLPAGTYSVVVSFKDKEKFGNFKLPVTIKVKSFIEAGEFVGSYGRDNMVAVKFYDNYGDPYMNKEVIFSYGDYSYKVMTDSQGIARFSATSFLPGNYTIYATHLGVGQTEKVKFTIKPSMEYLDLDIKLSSNSATLSVTLPKEGEAIFNINGEEYFVQSVDKVASLHFNNLAVGKYAVVVSYDYPNYVSQNKVFTIGFGRANILVDDVEVYYGDEASLYITLYDKAGNTLNDKNITIRLDGEIYKLKTNHEGVAELEDIFLEIGSYTAKITYVDEYRKVYEASPSILVKSRIVPIVTDGFANQTSIYSFKVLDYDGSPFKNRNIAYALNGERIEQLTDENGIVKIPVNLAPGSYQVTITYGFGMDYLFESSNINAYGISLNSTVVDYTANIVADVPYGTGNVIFDVDGEKYTVPIKSHKAELYLDDLDDGSHKLTATIENTNVFNSTSLFVDLNRESVVLTSKDIEMYYRNGTALVINLHDKYGVPLNGEKVQIYINGVPYTRTINNGSASMGINLVAGYYVVKLAYKGSIDYRPTKTNVSIHVMETISGDDIVKVFKNDTAYEASFLDNGGNPLVGATVDLNINGVLYHRKTNETGGIRFVINLGPGNYTLTAINPINGELYSNNIHVISNMISEDFTMYYRNGSQYKMTLLDNQGNPVGANVTVKLNINGVIYQRRTNETGGINFAINLGPGVYVITAIYNDLMQANTVTVLSPIQGDNIEMSASDRLPFTALILNGQGQVEDGSKLTLNINGIVYTRTVFAEKGGVIALNINLAPGEYIVTLYYPITYSTTEATLSQSYTVRVRP